MRILWVKPGPLWPPNAGGRIRSYHILRELAQRHRVTLLTTHGAADDPGAAREALSFCEEVRSFPHDPPKHGTLGFAAGAVASWFSPLPIDVLKWQVPAVRKAAGELLGSGGADLCVADFAVGAGNVPPGGRVPVVFFDHNVEHVIWQRLSRARPLSWQRPFLELESRKMRRFESGACRRAALTLAVSEVDRELLAAIAPGARVGAVPTGVDTAYFAPAGTPADPTALVFMGALDWRPNEDAVVHFATQILPAIHRSVPQATLTVVGRNPGPRLKAVARASGVQLTGTVDDVRPHVARASVFVVPLLVGGGTRLKIFEALAMGKAVVSTGVGAEGLPLVPGRHFLQADDPRSFSAAVVSLLRDPARRRELGAAGRELVAARFSWPQVAAEFEDWCFVAAGAAPPC